MLKELLKKLLPAWVLGAYHFTEAMCAAVLCGFPTRRMMTIGVTGTKGKSSTANFLWAGLMGAGVKTAMFSTANLRVGGEERVNPYHMTMPNPFVLQRFFREAHMHGCRAVIVETTSQGVLQSRHRGIAYDVLVFTNLTPEHIEAHGSFERYRAAKQAPFRALMREPRKTIEGRPIPKLIIANADSPEAGAFLCFPADMKRTFGIDAPADVRAEDVRETGRGVEFKIGERHIRLKMLGRVSVLNALPAFALAHVLGLDEQKVVAGIESVAVIPGRFEVIAEEPFIVIVDYAHEPISLSTALSVARSRVGSGGHLIVVFGATGGRDRWKRPEMGACAARAADTVIVTNDDPFSEDPLAIIRAVSEGAARAGKRLGSDLFEVPDRRMAIRKAFSIAKHGDAVLIAGKGSEQALIMKGRHIPWDDRNVAREELYAYGNM